MDFTNKELAMIALLLDEDEQVAQEPRRYWVHSAWKKRENGSSVIRHFVIIYFNKFM